MQSAKRAVDLLNKQISSASHYVTLKATSLDVREMFHEITEELRDTSSPIDRIAVHGYFVSAFVSIFTLVTGTLVGFLALYVSWLL